MLAASRIAKVSGRITDLTVSMITITGMRGAGVPNGTKWLITELSWKKVDHSIVPNQRGKDKDKVKTKWLDGVKMYGNSPMKFEKIIKKKKEIKMRKVPGVLKLPKLAINSKPSNRETLFKLLEYWLLTSQNNWGTTINTNSEATQLNPKVILKTLA
jgi:hypothetical protein